MTLADDEFRYSSEFYTSSHFGFICCKGVYPYNYMDSFDRFEVTELPSQDAQSQNALAIVACL